ncbi:hypothetical protein TIFTF001_018799 [Ficus carica]|uniref:Glucosidase 2 subunit beta n=1 Tax=Ficus carica TaxID=3494 RepID=A0AA88DB28_FICCA|nr:hypothetical protein TIFTF001_018799 [Ficus carica]
MKKLSIILIPLVICVLIAASTVRSASSSLPKFHFLGISPEDEKYYKLSSEFIKCKDGSKKFTKAQLNDDFCDCPDGSDEPGTSACPNGKFYCKNKGHAPLVLFSSRVNDGICGEYFQTIDLVQRGLCFGVIRACSTIDVVLDCCDGSDEYDNKVKCPNTCWEAGKAARDKLKKKIATYQEGVTIRKQEVERAKVAIAKDEAELSKLQSEEKTLKGLVLQLKGKAIDNLKRKEQIEKAEEKERLRKEKEEKEKREAEEKRKAEVEAKQENSEDKTTESKDDDKIGSLDDYPLDQVRIAAWNTEDTVEAHDVVTAERESSDTTRYEEPSVQDVEPHPAKEIEESASISETGLDVGSKVSPDESGNDKSENTEGLSKEELGRLVASRWTGENTGKQTEDVNEKDNNLEDNESTEETPDETHDHEDDGYASETDDEHQRYDDDIVEDEIDDHYKEEDPLDSSSSDKYESDTESDSSDETTSSSSSWLEKIQLKVWNILQAVNLFQTPVNQSDAARIRNEYDESSAKLSKIQGRISSLTQKLKHDFGLDKVFYSFYDQCFEGKENKYVYKVCPFKKASQVEGHSTTSLGRWDKFEDSYRVMVFSNGDKCWNGPDRSLKVKLRCGLKIEVADVDEPSRCEYVALLSTPALCLEEKLKELQNKLDLMNKEQPENHDEL